MSLRAILLVATALAAGSVLPAPVAAQNDAPLVTGSSVRVVSTPVGGRPQRIVKGSLVRLEHDSVAIDAGDAHTGPHIETFDLRGGWRLQRLAGTRSEVGTGAAVGAVAGASLMGMLVATTSDCGWGCQWNAGDVVSALALGTAGGAVLGLMVGSVARGERWVPVTSGVHVALAPGRVGLRVEF